MSLTPPPTREAPALTRVDVAADPQGRRALVRLGTDVQPTAPVLRPWLHDRDPSGARIGLVPEGALLLAGDRVRVELRVGPGAWLDVVEPAGTVAYPMHARPGTHATWDVDVELGDGASLRWLSQPFVVACGAVVRRDTRLRVGEGSRVVLRETLVLGRSGEAAGSLSSRLDVTGPVGPVLVEELELGPTAPALQLGHARVLDSLLLLGIDAPPGCEESRFDLEQGGHLWRTLTDQTHRSRLEEVVRSAAQRTG